jgi:hypothetical protein
MVKTIRTRALRTTVTHTLYFDPIMADMSGYAFECNADGVVNQSTLPELALKNYTWVTNGPGKDLFHEPYVRTITRRTWDPAVIECGNCGRHHALIRCNDMGDSQCRGCGQWHNAMGQQLVPPSQWGEDTGESFTDDGFLKK